MAATEIEYPKASELRERLVEAGAKARELRETPAAKRGDTYESDVRETIRTINSLDAEESIARKREAAELETMLFNAAVAEQEAIARRGGNGPSAATGDVGGHQARTLGELVVANEGFTERRTGQHINLDVDGEVRTLITTSTSDTPSAGVLMTVGQPIPPTPRRIQFFIRDLLASGNTNLHSFPYIRELTPATNETAASAVAEGGTKPEATMSFVTVTATAHKLAAWVPATMEILDDAPTLRSYIDQRLVYMVKYREQADLIAGVESGANPTVPGITTIGGTQTQGPDQSNSVDDPLKTAAIAIGKVENVDGEADGIAMNPTDFWGVMSLRWGTAGGQFDAAPFQGPPGTFWGLPVVRSRALSQYTMIVGAWRAGGQVFDRQGINVRTSDSHDTYFVLNKIAILAEERVAVAWYRPDFFVICDIHT